ncbi:hypothetical protein F2Q65_17360 [Thiohalocapsa marina]|uniref:Uncharacterized protein n=1 Tax=Thiohalocapsa marina TaxID=424902 RepID=A0A5M8FFP9_9GAMM|nr:hypothetical protein [Thiohalocapsa marina]KAA6182740.1 hypothetical protein F2Q65_17360 [Thiohalocapsa marina]
MLTLADDTLVFDFPDVEPRAGCRIALQRTLRIPDDGQRYPLPPGLGSFPLRPVDDHLETVPEDWARHGGVFLPMYQSEALWIDFTAFYPCAVKIAAGKINAVSGKLWANGLQDDPQDYVVVPAQPWLDGFNVDAGLIRQFVAMPLGLGYTAEEQLTGAAEHGGVQLAVYPMKADLYRALFPPPEPKSPEEGFEDETSVVRFCRVRSDMGLAAGGLMRQTIHADPYGLDAWDQDHVSRCFVHLLNSKQYQAVTGERPPHRPFKAKSYAKAGLPWFHHYREGRALPGARLLAGLTSVGSVFAAKKGRALPENGPLGPLPVKPLGKAKVREEDF